MNYYDAKEKEKQYNNSKSAWEKVQIEHELNQKGYERKPGFGQWNFDKKKESDDSESDYYYESNSASADSASGIGVLIILGLFVLLIIAALFIYNTSLLLFFSLFIPFLLISFIKNKFVKDLLSLIPLYFLIDKWILVSLIIHLFPKRVKNVFNIHLFSVIYSGMVLYFGFIQFNELRLEKNIGFIDGFVRYNWFSLLNSDPKVLYWIIPIYLIIMIPSIIISNRKNT
ncbi:hypothetical protein [Ferdinandcohnia sp. Marseille-Q9671]